MPDLVIKNHDPTVFPVLDGLDKPDKSTVRKVIRVTGRARQYVLSKSPFHGVTRLSLLIGARISQTFNNGKGDSEKQGRYLQAEATDVIEFVPGLDQARICWRARNTYGIRKVVLELFAQGGTEPIWSTTWADAASLDRLLKDPLQVGTKEKRGRQVPIKWTGSIDWDENVVIKHPDYPDGRLTAAKSPYQLRLTVNEGNPRYPRPQNDLKIQPLGYPLIAWTYIHVPRDVDESELDGQKVTDLGVEEIPPLTLLVPEKAGVGYTLNDGIAQSDGVVDADGILVHPISPGSTGCVLTFKDDGQSVEFTFAPSSFEEQDYWDEFLDEDNWEGAGTEDDIAEILTNLADDDDDEQALTLLIPDKANQIYTLVCILDDGTQATAQGAVDADGILVHEMSPQVSRCVLTFGNETEGIELQLS